MKYRFFLLIVLSIFIIPGLNAQKKVKKFFVTGIVTDSDNKPVEGAMILLDNKYTNKKTNIKGFFRVKVRPEAELISVVTTDMGIGEAIIDGTSMLKITLREGEAPVQLPGALNKEDEERINIGYGSVRKRDLTTPVNRLDVNTTRYSSYTNMYELLNGAFPGVQVSGTKITIRGVSSINLSSDPLFIVDGIEVSSISDISPTEVESVEVLKGAAASIYGSRGANGVILIRLKRGPDLERK